MIEGFHMWIVLLVAAVALPASLGFVRLASILTPVKADEYRAPYMGL
jgi:hypothetical protein